MRQSSYVFIGIVFGIQPKKLTIKILFKNYHTDNMYIQVIQFSLFARLTIKREREKLLAFKIECELREWG